MNTTLINIAAILVLIWGVAHLFPTMSVLNGFGEISTDNKRILLMEWINEGLTLIFMGVLLLLITNFGVPDSSTAQLVLVSSAVMLFGMAALSLLTGFKVSIVPFKLCPFIFGFSGVLILLGVFL